MDVALLLFLIFLNALFAMSEMAPSMPSTTFCCIAVNTSAMFIGVELRPRYLI